MDFDREHSFRYAEAETVGSGLTRVTARNPGALTFHGTGTYLLGARHGVVIDPGPKIQEHFDVLTELTGRGHPEHVLVTHRHQDHAGLAHALAASAGIGVAAYGTQRRDGPDSLDGETPEPGFVPDTRLSDGDLIEGPDYKLEVMHTPGHTADHICFIDKPNRRVFCGDHIMAWSTTVILPPDGHVGRYIESLQRLRHFGGFVFWPTHGPPISDPVAWIDQLIAHRRHRERQLLDALKSGPVGVETLLSRVYPDIEPRLRGAARQSLLAGLEWLLEQGAAILEHDGANRPIYGLRESWPSVEPGGSGASYTTSGSPVSRQ